MPARATGDFPDRGGKSEKRGASGVDDGIAVSRDAQRQDAFPNAEPDLSIGVHRGDEAAA